MKGNLLQHQPQRRMDEQGRRCRRVARIDLLPSPQLTDELRALLAPPERTPEGYLLVEGFGSRTGIQVYRDADGSPIREYRPPEEVFASDSLHSFIGRAVTQHHPRDFVELANDSEHRKGAILAVDALQKHGLNKVRFIVFDAQLIQAIEGGLEELSMGYSATVVMEKGDVPASDPIHAGEKYDAVQRVIQVNHLACVDRGRAGHVGRVRLDADGHAIPDGAAAAPPTRSTTVKITINGVTYDIDDQAAQAIQAERATHDAEKQQLNADAAEVRGKLDAAKAELDKRPTENDLRLRLDAEAQKRAQLIADASPYLPLDYSPKGKSDLDLKRDALCAEYPDTDWSKKDDADIPGAFAFMVETVKRAKKKSNELRDATRNAGSSDPEQQRADALEKLRREDAEQYTWNPVTRRNERSKPVS